MTEISSLMVTGLGVGTVFVGLIAIIVLCYIMSAAVKLFEKGSKKESAPAQVSAPAPSNAPIANKQEIVAASCAIIAEELGTDAKNIKVKSFKRV
ncbi:MAG: OadG family protein [Clostridia bacterium]|nr:OadG family protein [Clostridia bacterium]